ncbi:MAG: hypothetical protein CMI94_01475 [Pelagibacteraceae bacterium]|nr:hypothetical protein [Pelagibacteraceae bacterium]
MILKHKKTQILFTLILFFCFLLMILFGLRNNVKDINKDLRQISKSINKKENLVNVLTSDFTSLSNSDRIKKIAKTKLGLQKTNSYQVKKDSDFYIR